MHAHHRLASGLRRGATGFGLSMLIVATAWLALLPPAVAGVAGALWFRSMLSFPVDLLTGAVHGTDAVVRGLGGQAMWLAFCLCDNLFTGIKTNSAIEGVL